MTRRWFLPKAPAPATAMRGFIRASSSQHLGQRLDQWVAGADLGYTEGQVSAVNRWVDGAALRDGVDAQAERGVGWVGEFQAHFEVAFGDGALDGSIAYYQTNPSGRGLVGAPTS